MTKTTVRNTKDMNENGQRKGPLWLYGNAFSHTSIDQAIKAWDVTETYLINPTIGNQVPPITSTSGPKYMMRFDDGLWRHVSFGGLNGEPWFFVEADGYEGETGEIAYLYMLLRSKKKAYRTAKAAYIKLETEFLNLHDRLQELKEAHIRRSKKEG